MIPFNKPYLSGKELEYIKDTMFRGQISGNGYYTQKCHEFFQNQYGFEKCLLTTSGTDALEMAAILSGIQEGDEVIAPSYTFVSTVNAFVLRGAKIIFVDSKKYHPGIDESKIELLITSRTKLIVLVHYGGIACDMGIIMDIAKRYNLLVVEDASHSIDSFYNGKPLGGIGHLGCFSFHETKNIQCGEGGMLVINEERFSKRAEIIWEKGTNRAEFFRGEVNKYGWEDIGSSFLPSEMIAAYLFAQIENLAEIQNKRKNIWDQYFKGLSPLAKKGYFTLPVIPEFATNNGHLFYLICHSSEERTKLIKHLTQNGVQAVFHYLSLHTSDYYYKKHDGRELPHCDRFADCLVRLPLFYELRENQVKEIVELIKKYFD